jgi:hypothetical protein
VCPEHSTRRGPTLAEPNGEASDADTSTFNLSDYRDIAATVLEDDRRRVIVETDQPSNCPSGGVFGTRRKERRFQRTRDIPAAGAVETLGPSAAGTGRSWPARGWRSSNPRPRYRVVPDPPAGAGTTSLTLS